MPLQDYLPAELEPRHLTKEEIENPYQVIAELFSYDHLPEIRKTMFEWLKLTVSGGFHKECRSARYDLVDFYEHLLKLVEAAHLIHKERKAQSND